MCAWIYICSGSRQGNKDKNAEARAVEQTHTAYSVCLHTVSVYSPMKPDDGGLGWMFS